MRNLLFCFSISLSAFIVGLSFADFKFSDAKKSLTATQTKIKTNTENINQVEETESETDKTGQKKQKTKFVCKNKAFSYLLTVLRNDSELKGYPNDFIAGAQIENCDELFEIKKQIDLNKDGNKELIVRTKNSPKGMFLCGATGNCSTWILSVKNKQNFKVILDAGSIEEIKSVKGKTHAFQNLSSRYHGGMMNHTIGVYKFTGEKYKLTVCSEENGLVNGGVVLIRQKLTECE